MELCIWGILASSNFDKVFQALRRSNYVCCFHGQDCLTLRALTHLYMVHSVHQKTNKGEKRVRSWILTSHQWVILVIASMKKKKKKKGKRKVLFTAGMHMLKNRWQKSAALAELCRVATRATSGPGSGAAVSKRSKYKVHFLTKFLFSQIQTLNVFVPLARTELTGSCLPAVTCHSSAQLPAESVRWCSDNSGQLVSRAKMLQLRNSQGHFSVLLMS